MRRHRLDLFIWLALLVAAGLEFGASLLPIPTEARPILMLPAAAMAALVALGYMRLLAAPELARCFAVVGVFWLAVLLGLAMMDPLTRAIYPALR